MKVRTMAQSRPVAARRFSTGAKVAALLGMAAGMMALALLLATLVPS